MSNQSSAVITSSSDLPPSTWPKPTVNYINFSSTFVDVNRRNPVIVPASRHSYKRYTQFLLYRPKSKQVATSSL